MSTANQPAQGPHFIISVEGEIHGDDTPENRELVRRIHACVNACEGISTEELEKGIIYDMRRVIADVAPLLKQQFAAKDQPANISAPGQTAGAQS